jgi:hypothetical protein
VRAVRASFLVPFANLGSNHAARYGTANCAQRAAASQRAACHATGNGANCGALSLVGYRDAVASREGCERARR